MKLQHRQFILFEVVSLITLIGCMLILAQADFQKTNLYPYVLVVAAISSFVFLMSFCGALYIRWSEQVESVSRPHIVVFWLLCGSLLSIWAIAMVKTYLSYVQTPF